MPPVAFPFIPFGISTQGVLGYGAVQGQALASGFTSARSTLLDCMARLWETKKNKEEGSSQRVGQGHIDFFPFYF